MWLIPAWAGKTLRPSSPTSANGAHPRVGGENSWLPSDTRTTLGSSPRGRGKRAQQGAELLILGLIPAWAGKTNRLGARSRRSWAHPRVGGENLVVLVACSSLQGSSPRGRGKPVRAAAAARGRRLIPAWAGKTHEVAGAGSAPRAHPRVGGENRSRRRSRPRPRGSSPRGRGKPRRRRRDGEQFGLIPAWAGKTRDRLCGRAEPGLIPAWAGKTPPPPYTATHSMAHPRVGGENSRTCAVSTPVQGSSPRGRGKHTCK